MEWVDLDGKIQSKASTKEEIKLLYQKFTLGVTGPELTKIDNLHAHILDHKHQIFPFLKLYCRVSPTQKDNIIKSLIKAGYNPSMCGDGSNDVGALKRAVIGIALLNSDEVTDKKDKNKNFNILSLDDDTTINSGDVTAAAPFTSKSGSIKCVKNIMIQGRCTLVITFQMFKILALNCFLTAYSSSILALKGIKFSDYQVTYLGFVVAFFFLMLSKAEPLKKISKHKPPFTILTFESLISIVGQACSNLVSLFLVMEMTKEYDPESLKIEKSFDDPFTPTLMNSVIYIYTVLNNTINFVVNYQGEPFMRKMSENKWLMRLIFFVLGISVVVIFDIHQPLNEGLELLPLPEDFMYKIKFMGIMIGQFLFCYVLENWKKLLGYYN